MAALPAGEWLFKIILEARKRKSSNNGLMSDEPGKEHNIHVEDEHMFQFKDLVLHFHIRAAKAPKVIQWQGILFNLMLNFWAFVIQGKALGAEGRG